MIIRGDRGVQKGGSVEFMGNCETAFFNSNKDIYVWEN